uniref:DUF1738 domain-containing protein n=1 Tax=Steinernema glaseri TaxID=37863 RepID=A0A1I7ZIQ9_9BILA
MVAGDHDRRSQSKAKERLKRQAQCNALNITDHEDENGSSDHCLCGKKTWAFREKSGGRKPTGLFAFWNTEKDWKGSCMNGRTNNAERCFGDD